MSKLYHWMRRNALISTLVVIWTLALCTWVTWRVFGNNPPDIPTGTAAAFATVFGLPAVAVGLWKWRSERGD